MSEVEAVAAEAAPAPVTIVEAEKPTIEQTMGEVFDKLNPDTRVARSDTGQFKSKAEGAPGDTAEQVTDKEPAAVTEETAPPSIPRPQSLSSDVDELWGKLPPKAQELWAKRESEAHKQITELGQIAKATEPVRPQLEQLQKLAQMRGVKPEEAIQRFLAADDFLARDPAAAIQWLAQSYRVDLSKLVQPQLNSDNPESVHINALHSEIAQLKQQLYGVTNQITSREQADLQAREQSLTASIDKFAEGKDYWPEIEDEVYTEVLALKAANPDRAKSDPIGLLKDAHDRALKLTGVQDKLDKAAKEDADIKAKAESKKKADEAKKLASLNVRSATGTAPKASSKSIEDEMAEIYDRLQATG